MKVKLLNLKDNEKLIKLLNDNDIRISYLNGPKPLGMIIFCDFSSYQLDTILSLLKKNNIDIPLKAIETKDNMNWPIDYLYYELVKEHIHYKMWLVKLVTSF